MQDTRKLEPDQEQTVRISSPLTHKKNHTTLIMEANDKEHF